MSNLIFTRRSCRKYTTDVPSEEAINKVIEAGLYAPSGHNQQSWLIIAVLNKGVQQRLRKVNAEIWGKSMDPFYGAPVILIVLADKSKKTYLNDGSLVLGNMMLEAHELGLASCWINRAKETFQRKEWQEWLRTIGVNPEVYEGIGHLALGYADGPLPAPLPRKPGKVLWVK